MYLFSYYYSEHPLLTDCLQFPTHHCPVPFGGKMVVKHSYHTKYNLSQINGNSIRNMVAVIRKKSILSTFKVGLMVNVNVCNSNRYYKVRDRCCILKRKKRKNLAGKCSDVQRKKCNGITLRVTIVETLESSVRFR